MRSRARKSPLRHLVWILPLLVLDFFLFRWLALRQGGCRPPPPPPPPPPPTHPPPPPPAPPPPPPPLPPPPPNPIPNATSNLTSP